jgi:fibronectin-binding autotransporter adhesin
MFAVNPGSGTINLGTSTAGTAGATLTLNSGTSFSMVDGAIGTVNLQQQASFASSGLTLGGDASLNFEVGSATADKLAVTKGATVTGTNLINVAGVTSMGGGPYDLITAPSGLSGTYVFGGSGTTSQTVAVGTNAYALTLGGSDTAVTLNVGSATSISGVTWTGQTNGNGAANSNWDNAISNNWAAISTASAVSNGTAVTFGDTNAANSDAAITNTTVTVATLGVSPTSTTFNNSDVNYTVGGGAIGGTGTLTKSGTGTVTLSGANSYTGATTVSAGTLVINGDQSLATGTVTVNDGGILGGSGTLGGGLVVNEGGVHNAGNSPGLQTINGQTTYNSGSIFEWDLAGNVSGTSLTQTWDHDNNIGTAEITARGSAYDAVNINGGLTINADAIFKVIMNIGVDFNNVFWTANQTWSNIFNQTGTLTSGWNNIAVSVYNTSNVLQDVSSYGSFTMTGATLSWQAIPEPTTALAGLLLAAGLLRRRRK